MLLGCQEFSFGRYNLREILTLITENASDAARPNPGSEALFLHHPILDFDYQNKVCLTLASIEGWCYTPGVSSGPDPLLSLTLVGSRGSRPPLCQSVLG